LGFKNIVKWILATNQINQQRGETKNIRLTF